MRIVQLFVIISAVTFLISKLVLYVDPALADVAADGAASFGFSVGFIIGSIFYLAPFIVAYIREHVYTWWILALLIGAPFVGGFYVGFIGAGPAGMSFVNSVIVPIVWVGGLIWSVLNPKSQKLSDSDSY